MKKIVITGVIMGLWVGFMSKLILTSQDSTAWTLVSIEIIGGEFITVALIILNEKKKK